MIIKSLFSKQQYIQSTVTHSNNNNQIQEFVMASARVRGMYK